MQRVFHFSGGRTSAYMLINNYQPGDIVIFCDTGREHEGTLKFVDEVSANENIPIIKLQYKGGFKELIRKRQTVPERFQRFCTIELKIRTARRYLRSIGLFKYIQFVGFRHDEQDRIKKYENYWQQVQTIFLLDEQRVCKPEILLWWKTKSYNLEIPPILGNCDCCFQKGKAAILAILQSEPERADKWIEDEETNKNKHTYFKGVTFRELKEQAQALKIKYDLNEIKPAFNCACGA